LLSQDDLDAPAVDLVAQSKEPDLADAAAHRLPAG
jgi:hypothetical protein